MGAFSRSALLPPPRGILPLRPAKPKWAFHVQTVPMKLVIRGFQGARQSIRTPADSFTSKDIARAVVDARKRGVDERVVLDDSPSSTLGPRPCELRRSHANKLALRHHAQQIPGDRRPARADGSFNYTMSAQQRNAENVIVLWNSLRLQRRASATGSGFGSRPMITRSDTDSDPLTTTRSGLLAFSPL
jgi:phosphatidylserine/phosphatidylglycerophosphate/cardiolipin synthase-like enzyme